MSEDRASSQELRHTIEQTKMALSEKIAALNDEVRDTVNEASSRVRKRLHEARESIDPSIQFHRHPWVFCISAAFVGFMIHRRNRRSVELSDASDSDTQEPSLYQPLVPQGGVGPRFGLSSSIRATLVPLVAEVVAGVLQRRRDPKTRDSQPG